MFKFAQQIVRHKIGFVAVAAFAVFVFTKDSQEQAAEASSGPWSKQAEVVAASSPEEQDGMMSGAVDKAVTAASDYLGEATGVNPMEVKEQTVDSFSNTANAMNKANAR